MLAPLVDEVRDFVRSSKSDNTNKQYDYYFGNFEFLEWCRLYKFSALPADACIVVLYISFLVQKNVSVLVLNSNFFSISWKHDFNLLKNPCKEYFVVLWSKVQGEFCQSQSKRKNLLQLK